MHALQQMFPSLTLFSDLDWDAVTKEYETEYMDISFPEYLQQKALDGDCPPYLFELAFFELALFDTKTSSEPLPHQPGIYLNPTALFLSLEFDIRQMLQLAKEGNLEIIEKPHVLCLYRNQNDEIEGMEMSEEELEILQHLEDGPQMSRDFIGEQQRHHFQKFLEQGLVLDLID